MKRRSDIIIEIAGHELPVVVTSDGVFWAEWEGESYKATTLKGLRVKLLPKVRTDTKRCEVPALYKSYGDTFEPITLIGLHADNGNVLYRDKEGKTSQVGRRAITVYRPLNKAERNVYAALRQKVQRAERAVDSWLKARRIEPGKMVRAALGLPPDPTLRDEPGFDDE